MSADEIAALQGGIDDDGNPVMDEAEKATETAAAIARGEVEEEGDGSDPVAAAPAAPAPPANEPAPAAPTAPAEPPAAAPTEQPADEIDTTSATFVPQYKAEVPADAAEQIKALKGEEADAFAKLMDGTIDAKAYQEVKERTEAAVDDLKTKSLTAKIFQDANQQAAEQAAANEWKRTEADRMAAFKAEGIDYRGKPALLAAFNHNLKALGNDPANEARDGAWFLNEAHKRTKDDLGFKPAPTAPTPPAAPPARGVDKSTLPPTLSRVPPAADPTVGADEFSHLANLSGVDLERAVAKLDDAAMDRYLSA
jgi:hypothetical protein